MFGRQHGRENAHRHNVGGRHNCDARRRTARWRPGGAGPLYWSTYDYENSKNVIIPEAAWKKNVDWVADTFRDYGYTMVCTDGWIDNTQKITPHGYILSQADDWAHDWAWWAKYLQGKGLELGVYYNPLWATRSAVDNPSVTVVGRPDIKVADIVNPGDHFNGPGTLQWVDTTRDGAEEYVKGYVAYFRDLGATFLRIDFLAWYENGYDQSGATPGRAHGRDSYLQALEWMSDAAGDMQLSLVMPNLFDHGAGERKYGDLIRIDNDASFGTWFHLSGFRQTWQPEWSQWDNPFLGFTGFSDISGRGQMTLDGDPLIMHSFANDAERQTAINLFTMAGAAIAITDTVDTIGNNAHVFQNREVLALRTAGLVGKPVYNSSHGFDYDQSSRDPERWIGQLPDGRWAVALFNREDGPGTIDQVHRLRARARHHRSSRRARSLGAQGLGFDDALRGSARAARIGPVVGGATGTGSISGRGRDVGRLGALREHVRRARRDGLRHRPHHRRKQCGRGRQGARRRQPPTPVPSRQRHWPSVVADCPCARSRDRHGPRNGHAPRTEHSRVDDMAVRAGDPHHGRRHEPRGVQRRVVRYGCGQSRLARAVELRSFGYQRSQ